jgi:acetyl-CoA C-acetyltransferase
MHEAFAAQVLSNLKAFESKKFAEERLGRSEAIGSVDESKLNVNGGSIALGHPFAATVTRIVASLAKILAADRSAKRGLFSVCTACGMGVTAILERA